MTDRKLPEALAVAMLVALPGLGCAQAQDVRNAAEAVAGIYSSIYLHEAGHALVFASLGARDIRIEVPRPGTLLGGVTRAATDAPLSPGERRVLAASGLVAANLAGEAVLRRPRWSGQAYGQAVLGTAVVSNLVHVAQYYGKVRGQGGWQGNDIDEYELAGGNPHLLSAALAGYSLWTLHRMQQRSIPLFFVQMKF